MSVERPPLMKPGAFKWDALGYFYREDIGRSTPEVNSTGNPWLHLDELIESAARGNVEVVPAAFDLLETEHGSWVFSAACSGFIGDACPSSHLREHVDGRLGTDPFDVDIIEGVELARMLANCGELWVVPRLLTLIEAFRDDPEAKIVPLLLSELLEPTYGWIAQGPGSAKDFARRVTSHSDSIFPHHDATTAVFLGEASGAEQLARHVLSVASTRPIPSILLQVVRHRFEAMTGINCTGFFTNEVPVADRVESIIERFMESEQHHDFSIGERRFFGQVVG